jgi:hypothetical protein
MALRGNVINYDLSSSPCCDLVKYFADIKTKDYLNSYNSEDFYLSRQNTTCNGCTDSMINEALQNLQSHGNPILTYILNNLPEMENIVREKADYYGVDFLYRMNIQEVFLLDR